MAEPSAVAVASGDNVAEEEEKGKLRAADKRMLESSGEPNAAADGDDNNNRKRTKNNNGRGKKKEKVNLSWNPSGKEIHAGSYASEEQRVLFGVTVPDRPTTTTADEPLQLVTITSKKKVAVLLGYLGTNYGGFQINKNVRTLQAEFELALLKAGLLSHDNFGYPSKISWSTSGRTDKGVHAAAQTVSFKMELTAQQLMMKENARSLILDPLNAVLPPDMRALDVVRTTRNFCAKTQRDRVRYQYMIPSFCFSDHLKQLLADTSVVDYPANGQPAHAPVAPHEVQRIQAAVADYRVTTEQLSTLKQVLNSYVGTHSFHNFTRRCAAGEMRANRYIMEFAVQDPVVVDGVEWIPTTVTGQSFLLNQIRKMVCLAMDVVRGATGIEMVQKALDKRNGTDSVRIALAPPQGLYLDMSFYSNYNRRKGGNNNATEAPDLDWFEPGTAANERWKDFRDNVIMKHVVAEEAAQGNFIQHLYMQEHCFDFNKFYQQEEEDATNEDSGGEAEDNNN